MRILCLFKRRYMRKDVIVDRYARLYELPLALAQRGHHVHVICLNYRGVAAPFETIDKQGCGRLHWQSSDLGPLLVPGLLRYRRMVRAALAQSAPDLILGGSDSLHVAMTCHFARAVGLPYALDLYDNYASFGLTRLPGLTRAYARALADADAVTCVSDPLRAMVVSTYAPRGPVITLESTINRTMFYPRNRAKSRQRLGLPQDAHLVGTAGALDASRGIATLYRAYQQLRTRYPKLHLVLAGSRDGAEALPDAPGIIHLGELAHERIPDLFSALDVAIICMRDTAFGRYAFPQKAYEIIACHTPVVAARVGALSSLLADQPHSLYDVDNVASLRQCIEAQLTSPTQCTVVPPDWAAQAGRLEGILLNLTAEAKK